MEVLPPLVLSLLLALLYSLPSKCLTPAPLHPSLNPTTGWGYGTCPKEREIQQHILRCHREESAQQGPAGGCVQMRGHASYVQAYSEGRTELYKRCQKRELESKVVVPEIRDRSNSGQNLVVKDRGAAVPNKRINAEGLTTNAPKEEETENGKSRNGKISRKDQREIGSGIREGKNNENNSWQNTVTPTPVSSPPPPPPQPPPHTTTGHHKTIPATSVWCHNTLESGLQCQFENLYYSPAYREFAFVSDAESTVSGVDTIDNLKGQLWLSSVAQHNAFAFHISALPRYAFATIATAAIPAIEGVSMVMARFKPDNLLHVFHDDLLPLYFTLRRVCIMAGVSCPSITLLACDEHDPSPHLELYYALTSRIILTSDLQKNNLPWVRLAVAVVGLDRRSVWYQYGFGQPQGPTASRLTGPQLRQFTAFMMDRLWATVNTATGASIKDSDSSTNSPVNPDVNTPSIDVNATVNAVTDAPLNAAGNTHSAPPVNSVNTPRSGPVSSAATIPSTPMNTPVNDMMNTHANAPVGPISTPVHAGKNTQTDPSVDARSPSTNSRTNANMNSASSSSVNVNAGSPVNVAIVTPAKDSVDAAMTTPSQAVLLTRRITRKILNERQLADAVAGELWGGAGPVWPGKVQIMSLEENGLKVVIREISKAGILVGMHGAALVLGMFMPPGSLLVELWPYGIDPSSAPVYRAMCALQDSGLAYVAWENKDARNTLTHPEYPPYNGGLGQLSEEERNRITSALHGPRLTSVTCCDDPDWLYRIYQDTEVRLYEHDMDNARGTPLKSLPFTELLHKGLQLRYETLATPKPPQRHHPARVRDLQCFLRKFGNAVVLNAQWHKPWTADAMPCEVVVYEVVVEAYVGGARGGGKHATGEYVQQEVYTKWFAYVVESAHIWVTCLCEGVEGPYHHVGCGLVL